MGHPQNEFEVQTQKSPAGCRAFLLALIAATRKLLLFCGLLGCLFCCCLLGCLLCRSLLRCLLCCFLNGQLVTSFISFTSALRRGFFRSLSAFGASGFLGGLLCGLLGRSFLRCFFRRSFFRCLPGGSFLLGSLPCGSFGCFLSGALLLFWGRCGA